MSSPKKKPSKSKPKATKRPSAPRRAAADSDVVDIAKMGDPLQSYNRSLPVVLTPSEYDERGHEAGTLSAQIKALEADKRAKNEALNAEIKKANARLDQVHAQLNTRTEDREVECMVFTDIGAGLKLTVRSDTGKILGKEKMSPAEKRGDVEITPPAPPVDEATPIEGKRGRKVKGKAKDEAPPDAPEGEAPEDDASPSDGDDGKGDDEGDGSGTDA